MLRSSTGARTSPGSGRRTAPREPRTPVRRRVLGAPGARPRGRTRRGRHRGRAVRGREVEPAPPGLRPGRADDGSGRARRRRPRRRAGPATAGGHGVPGLRPVPPPDGPGEHRLRAAGAPGAGHRHPGRRAWPTLWGSEPCSTADRSSCRVASGSGSPWPGPWCGRPGSSASTSRSPASIPSCGPTPGSSWPTCSGPTGAAGWSSPTTRREALTMGDRVAVLQDGRLEQVGTPREVYTKPADRLRRLLHRQPADDAAAPSGARRRLQRRPRRRAGRARASSATATTPR